MVRIVVADEQRIFREGLRKLLEAEHGWEVVGEASDGAEALSLARALSPDILLLDVAMPKLSGLEVLRELARQPQATAVILLAGSIAPPDLLRALRFGARGIVMKQSPASTLPDGIRQVMAGQYWIGRESTGTLMKALKRLSLEAPHEPSRSFGLTRRELEVTAAIVAAQSNKDIAQSLALSEKTVKHHVTSIFDKLGVSTRLQLAVFVRQHDLELPDLDRPIERAG